jgi:hypothetical protein
MTIMGNTLGQCIYHNVEFAESNYLNLILTEEETQIVRAELKEKLEVVYSSDGRQSIKASHYIGYVVLPYHIISIRPKSLQFHLSA